MKNKKESFDEKLAERVHLIRVSRGKAQADLYIKGARVLNVFTGEVLEQNIAVADGRIAYVGASEIMVGPQTEVIDAGGLFIVPGYFDPHGHVDIMYNPLAFTEAVLPKGTTSIAADNHNCVGALGRRGIKLMLDLVRDLPLNFFLGIPPVSPPLPQFEGEDIYPLPKFRSLLKNEGAFFLSETFDWPRAIEPDQEMLGKIIAARELGKRVEAHAPGSSADKLCAVAAAGFTSCHEAITAEEARNRLRLGLYVMLRHGSIRSDLDALAPLIVDRGVDTHRVMLTPDLQSAKNILNLGYMDHIIGAAIKIGIAPVKAYQMSTLAPATYFNLDYELGAIAPGRKADLNFLESLEEPMPIKVMANGRIVAENGVLTGPLPRKNFHGWKMPKFPLAHAEDGSFRTNIACPATVPAISMSTRLITRIENVRLKSADGETAGDGQGDLLKIAMMKHDGRGYSVGFIKGLGLKIGALATTNCHDSFKPMVLGRRDADMAVAARGLGEMGGGYVIVNNGQIVLRLPLPLGGIMSRLPIAELAKETERCNEFLRQSGCPFEDPLFTISFLPFTGVPYARITPSGILDVVKGQIVPTIAI